MKMCNKMYVTYIHVYERTMPLSHTLLLKINDSSTCYISWGQDLQLVTDISISTSADTDQFKPRLRLLLNIHSHDVSQTS